MTEILSDNERGEYEDRIIMLNKVIEDLNGRIKELEAKVKELKVYADHLTSCEGLVDSFTINCNCGLERVLKG